LVCFFRVFVYFAIVHTHSLKESSMLARACSRAVAAMVSFIACGGPDWTDKVFVEERPWHDLPFSCWLQRSAEVVFP
jgi:hypothetical protein